MGQRQKVRLTGSNNSCLIKEEGKSPSVLLELQFFSSCLEKVLIVNQGSLYSSEKLHPLYRGSFTSGAFGFDKAEIT